MATLKESCPVSYRTAVTSHTAHVDGVPRLSGKAAELCSCKAASISELLWHEWHVYCNFCCGK